ncbi:MFS transporter [Rhizobium tumorigenes]|uniref:MFS transporter n=1 Tax=Rhizobium tumorigenes TaxID=2041385 RepID=UPI00241EB7AF|nr:MFS transporter [Rhizobium tumorigenes]WFS04111.1 MFS transporter [Rhizobium tumorigenes]
MTLTYNETIESRRSAWGAVFSMTLCVFVLIASEFMPVSLLTPIAADLGVSEGSTGQAISISGIFAVFTSLFIAGLTQRLDRRLVTNDQVPKALALLNAGNAIAATISAPVGSLLGAYVGWRGAFFLVVPVGFLALVWQWITLPTLPPRRDRATLNVFRLLRRPPVALGMAAILLLFMGQFALFTYLRPFLEQVTHLGIETLSLALLLMGLAGAVGTWVVGRLLNHRLFSILIVIPALMACIALATIAVGDEQVPVFISLVCWGFLGTAAPVGWGTWLSRILADDAEAGGGLQVAVIQFAITAGASLGGLLFDAAGWQSTFVLSAALLCGSSLAAFAAWRASRRPS